MTDVPDLNDGLAQLARYVLRPPDHPGGSDPHLPTAVVQVQLAMRIPKSLQSSVRKEGQTGTVSIGCVSFGDGAKFRTCRCVTAPVPDRNRDDDGSLRH